MADKVKGITVEFRGDTSQLDKALRTIRSEARDLDHELQQVDRALKFNPKNTELVAQKQKLLKERVEQTSRSLDELKNLQKQMDAKGVDKNSTEYQKLRREIITTESKLKHFNKELNKTALQASKIHRLGAAFQSAGKKIEGAGQKLRGVSRAAGLVAVGLGAITYKAGQAADQLNTLSKQTGIDTGTLQKYAAAADLVDVSVESIAKAEQKLKKNMLGALDGTNDQAQYFKELGIEITNADGSLRDADDVFNDTVKALGKMENETQRDAYAMALMGKSATDLNPLIEDGGETYERVSKILKKYDLDVISQEDLDRANEFNDAVDTIKLLVVRAVQIIGTKVAGYLVPLMEKITKKVGEFSKKFSGMSGEVLAKFGAVMTAVALLSPALVLLGKVISGVGTVIQTTAKIVGGLSKALAFLATNPIALAIAGIAALVAAIVILWNKSEKFRDFFIGIWNKIKEKVTEFKTWFQETRKAITDQLDKLKEKAGEIRDKFNDVKTKIVSAWQNLPETFRKIWDNIGTGLKNIGSKIGNAVTGAIKSGINGVIQTIENIINKAIALINSAIRLANKLPGVNVGYVDKLNLPRLAKGGVLNGAQTVIAGEAGPEAIIPLDRLFAQLDKMTDKLVGEGGDGIVVNVYGTAGQSITDLAAEVERRLVEAQKRRRLAWQ